VCSGLLITTVGPNAASAAPSPLGLHLTDVVERRVG